ncbi:MAG: EpsI family protein [Deltaproteobacteria bacterium]|nr:EpsI family protein [Deltaproteobacteria bacterium]
MSIKQPNIRAKIAIYAKISALVLAVIWLYWSCFEYWWHTWTNNRDFDYVWVLPLVGFYAFWMKRKSIASAPVKPSKWGIPLIIVAMMLHYLGKASYAELALQVSFFLFLPGIVLFLCGTDILRKTLIGIVLCFFLTPFLIPFYPFLQELAAKLSWQVLTFLGFPAYRIGHLIELPNLTAAVDSGCIGIRYSFALIPIGLVMSYVSSHSRPIKFGIVFFSIILAFSASAFRITSILVLASMGITTFVYGKAHFFYGYSVFVVAVLVMLLVMVLLDRRSPERSASFEHEGLQSSSVKEWKDALSKSRLLFLIVFIVVLPGLNNSRLQNQLEIPVRKDLLLFPFVLGEWRGSVLDRKEWHPTVSGETQNLFRVYRLGDEAEVKTFVSYLGKQSQGSELVFHANEIVPKMFQNKNNNTKAWKLSSNSGQTILKTGFRRGAERGNGLYYFSWYKMGKWNSSNAVIAKALTGIRNIISNRSDGALIIMIFRMNSKSEEETERKMSEFVNNFANKLTCYLPS